MATDNILRSYGDSAAKEDVVMNAVEILTAKEVQIMNMLGKTDAIATVHEYLTDTLQTAQSRATAEGADYTALALTTPSRLTNIVQKVTIPFKVSRPDLVRSTLVSGASGTIPKMSGIIEATSKGTNHTSHTSGTAWDATILEGLMKDNYDNSNGDVSTDIFMGAFLR